MYFWFILGGKLNKYQKINLNNESNSPVPNRQTQESKSVQTAICDAAVDSLIKLGYAKTSISGVAKKSWSFQRSASISFELKSGD